jgi:hypothetical protein
MLKTRSQGSILVDLSRVNRYSLKRRRAVVCEEIEIYLDEISSSAYQQGVVQSIYHVYTACYSLQKAFNQRQIRDFEST